MRLSEAIREGSKHTEQAFGDYQDGYGTCALGAAMDAFGVRLSNWRAVAQWEQDYLLPVPINGCPLSCGATDRGDDEGPIVDIGDAVIHLNDVHRWTREQIADYVQTQEAIHGIGIEAETPELVEA